MNALEQLDKIRNEFLGSAPATIWNAKTPVELAELEVKSLGRKGALATVMATMKDLGPEERKELGAAANELKNDLTSAIEQKSAEFVSVPRADFDFTLPGQANRIGKLHPITQVITSIEETFARMGFGMATGPEIESDYYNFAALNFPEDHPARDMQDTFYLAEGNGLPSGLLLRTHTSNVQIREFERRTPPFKIIAPGRVFRHEAVSMRSYCVFHQVEGFEVGVGVSMADLKAALVAFCRDFFSSDVKLRFRPSYFPFTEPSAEVDITCFLCGGQGCPLCKHEGWLEILGCGMIDPNVMRAVGYDPEEVSGYAFGMGVERIAMLKYGITDIRLLYENDTRFIRQF